MRIPSRRPHRPRAIAIARPTPAIPRPVLLAAIAILGALVLALLPGRASAVETGQPAPAFTLADATGQTRHLADFAGKTVVLEWTNFECPFVKKHYGSGAMQALQQKWTAQGVVWLQVSSSAPGKQGHLTAADAQPAAQAQGSHATALLLDGDGTVGRAYAARTTPHLFVIDGKGAVVYQGAIDSVASADPADIPKATNHVDAALTALAAGRPVPVGTTKSYGCSVKY